MQRRLSKRGWIILLGGLLVISMGAFCAHLFFERPDITFKDDLIFDYDQTITVWNLISDVRKGTLINGKDPVNTTVLGPSKVEVKAKNHYGRQFSYEVTIEVVDNLAPFIEVPAIIEIIKGQQVDLLSYAKATDQAGEATLRLVGDYDPDKIGMQPIRYLAIDESGNESGQLVFLLIREDENDKKEYFMTDKLFSGYTDKGRTFIEGLPIINKTYGLPSSYGARGLTKDTSAAWKKMKEAALADGITLKVLSAYRNYGYQEDLFTKKVAQVGEQQALITTEKAGHSEHQAGIALDVNSLKESFAQSKEYEWLNKNCYKYGFIIRYPEGKTNYTGYVFEPWHITYVGEKWAEVLYNNGDWLCIEEYFGISSQYGD